MIQRVLNKFLIPLPPICVTLSACVMADYIQNVLLYPHSIMSSLWLGT